MKAVGALIAIALALALQTSVAWFATAGTAAVDLVLVVLNASQLDRQLRLALQVQRLGLPAVVALTLPFLSTVQVAVELASIV